MSDLTARKHNVVAEVLKAEADIIRFQALYTAELEALNVNLEKMKPEVISSKPLSSEEENINLGHLVADMTSKGIPLEQIQLYADNDMILIYREHFLEDEEAFAHRKRRNLTEGYEKIEQRRKSRISNAERDLQTAKDRLEAIDIQIRKNELKEEALVEARRVLTEDQLSALGLL